MIQTHQEQNEATKRYAKELLAQVGRGEMSEFSAFHRLIGYITADERLSK